MLPKDSQPGGQPFKFTYSIAKKDILDFVNSLHDMQNTYIEAAVEKSGYKEAKEVLARIMKL